MRSRLLLPALLVVGQSTACVDTGIDSVEIPLALAGTAPPSSVTTRSGWDVTLMEAELAVGPVMLCASTNAGELCDRARAEWLESSVVDLLDDEPQWAGALVGSRGMVRSLMFDFGYTSLLTQVEPVELSAARALGGSLRLVGSAERQGVHVDFDGVVAIKTSNETEQGVPLMRATVSPAHELTADSSLVLRFDAEPWIAALDFDSAAEAAECGETCVLSVQLDEQSGASRALLTEILGGARPLVQWRKN